MQFPLLFKRRDDPIVHLLSCHNRYFLESHRCWLQSFLPKKDFKRGRIHPTKSCFCSFQRFHCGDFRDNFT